MIFEELPPEEAEKPTVPQRAGFYNPDLDDPDGLDPYSRWQLALKEGEDNIEYLEKSLRLDVGSVRALKIVAVNYKHQESAVRRFRKTKGERQDF